MELTQNQILHQKDAQAYLPAFRRFPITLAKGEGCLVWDVEGKRYIDALAGIAVNNVGHCHPRVVEAIQKQAATLTHVSNFFLNVPQAMLSEKLISLSGLDRIFFTNSGAESLEGAIKIARKYAHSKGRGGEIISFTHSFHGRTMATIATGKAKYQKGFGPIPEGFNKVPFNDLQALSEAISKETAGILIEPIQGEGGINPADKEFLQALREICDQHDMALIFDEVQTGIGRTGNWFAKDHYGVQPDILTLAKGLGGGVPIGAILSNERVSQAIEPGDHGTTFGGNPLVCAAALATLEVIDEENLLAEAEKKGKWLRNKIAELQDPRIREIRGLGLMIGVEFEMETKSMVLDMLKMGVIANATADNVLRLVPPLVISYEHLEEIMDTLEKALKNIPSAALAE